MNIADEYVCNRKEDNMEFNYSYRLIKSDYRGTPVYGIEIERKDYIGIKNINIERDKVTMISFGIKQKIYLKNFIKINYRPYI